MALVASCRSTPDLVQNWNKKLGCPGPHILPISSLKPSPIFCDCQLHQPLFTSLIVEIYIPGQPRPTSLATEAETFISVYFILWSGTTSMLGFILHNSSKVEQQSFDLIRWHFSAPWNGDLVFRPSSLSSSSHFSWVSRYFTKNLNNYVNITITGHGAEANWIFLSCLFFH